MFCVDLKNKMFENVADNDGTIEFLETFRDYFLEIFLKTDPKDPRVVWEHDEENCIYDVFFINNRYQTLTRNTLAKKLPIQDNTSGYADTPGFSINYSTPGVIDTFVVYPDGFHEMYTYDIINDEIRTK